MRAGCTAQPPKAKAKPLQGFRSPARRALPSQRDGFSLAHGPADWWTTHGSITQNLAERAAFLLGSDFERRDQKFKETKKLYGQRSAIVHRGKKITEDDLYAMDGLVKQVIVAFSAHNFVSWPSFQKWVARKKFGNTTEGSAK